MREAAKKVREYLAEIGRRGGMSLRVPMAWVKKIAEHSFCGAALPHD